jgi:hypothetical protein
MAVVLHALRLLTSDWPDGLHAETEMTRALYLRILTARRALALAGEWVPDGLPAIDARNSPTPDTVGSPAERKQPDIQWGYQDELDPDPQRSARFFHIECKRLGGADLNSKYVDDGIMRFVSLGHRYGKDVVEGAMVGYVVEGQSSDAFTGVNARSATAGLPGVVMLSSEAELCLLESTLDRPFPKSPFRLHHVWIVICMPISSDSRPLPDDAPSDVEAIVTSP